MQLEELYTKTMSDEALKKAYMDAVREKKIAEFLAANGCEATEEELRAFLDSKENKTGELADDELDQVAGGKRCGTSYNRYGQPEVAPFNCCEFYTDKNTGERRPDDGRCDECKHDLGSFGSLGFRYCGCPERVYN